MRVQPKIAKDLKKLLRGTPRARVYARRNEDKQKAKIMEAIIDYFKNE